MLIAPMSDSHNRHDQFKLSDADLGIHCGDFSSMGYVHETKGFLEWFSKQPVKNRLFICGNHDGTLPEEQPSLFKEILKEYPGVTYLQNDGITIDGIKFWGRPYTPRFNDWFWMADPGSPKMLSSLDIIPKDTDVLITHGPPYGILDTTNGNQHVGCKDMRDWLEDGNPKPKLILCGHIHNGRGVYQYGDTTIVNCAVLNDWYRWGGNPMLIDFDGKTVKIIRP